jgi:hypothetical protein
VQWIVSRLPGRETEAAMDLRQEIGHPPEEARTGRTGLAAGWDLALGLGLAVGTHLAFHDLREGLVELEPRDIEETPALTKTGITKLLGETSGIEMRRSQWSWISRP